MVYVDLPDQYALAPRQDNEETNFAASSQRPLVFFLAMEEYVARHIAEPDCFFMWQVQPTVIFGRNQLIESEVNLEFCRQRGIATYRRKSGGGCVYADMSNVMFSYITDDENVNFTFNRYINMVLRVLYKMGVEATSSGRNDILIEGRKVSGNAFYHIPGRSIVHGTLLYDTDMENMVGSITPSDEKLRSKGVRSVRQHIALLKDYTNLTLSEFKLFVRQNLCDREIMLTREDVKRIEEIEREYHSPEFIYGNNPRYSIVRRKRIEEVGHIELRLELKNNIIRGANMVGDFFLTGDIDNGLLCHLKGVPLQREAIEYAIPEKIDDIVRNLKRDDFIQLIFSSE